MTTRLKDAIGVVSVFAKLSGFPERTLRHWLKGPALPSAHEILEIARLTGRRVGWLFGESDAAPDRSESAPPPSSAGSALISPIDVRAAAGHGSYNDRAVEIDRIAFPLDWLTRLAGRLVRADKCDVLRVSGDSMSPTIEPSALMLINRADTAIPRVNRKKRRRDDDIFVFIQGDDLCVKRLAQFPDGGRLILSDNQAAYPLEALSAVEAGHLHVLGRVIWRDNRL